MSIWRKLTAGFKWSVTGSGDAFADRLDSLSIHENWALRPRTLLFRNRVARRAV
jgi:hypothetical protein